MREQPPSPPQIEKSKFPSLADSAPILSGRQVIVIGGVFSLLVVSAMASVVRLAWRLERYFGTEIDCPHTWPVSIFSRRPLHDYSPKRILFIVGLSLFFVAVVRRRKRILNSDVATFLVALLLVLASNMIQGIDAGFETSVAGGGEKGIQYYHDAIKVVSPWEFLRDFNRLQPSLLCHSRTHPPGAVLVFWGFTKSIGDPRIISCVIATLSTVFSGLFLCRLLSRYFDAALSRYVTFLFLLVPSVQIYYCASVDALIATCLLGATFFFTHSTKIVAIVGTVICFLLASFLSFGAIFILPVLGAYVVVRRKRFCRALASIATVVTLYAAVFLLTGFNYLQAFITASALENPNGFHLMSEPMSYLLTCLEDVSEILLFLGPYLIVLGLRGFREMWREWRSNDLFLLSASAGVTVLAMILSGAFKTGETARICLFIYPYMMLPIAQYLGSRNVGRRDKDLLLYLTFGQTVLMQTVGNYFW